MGLTLRSRKTHVLSGNIEDVVLGANAYEGVQAGRLLRGLLSGDDAPPNPYTFARRGFMTVLLVLFFFITFLVIDAVKTGHWFCAPFGTMYTTPGFEMLGALAQDGGEPVENDYEI